MRLFLFALLLPVSLFCQETVSVPFKVFPSDYQVFLRGERLSFAYGAEGLRIYQLPAGQLRLSVTSAGSFPISLDLTVKSGGPRVEAKLEPRSSPLVQQGETATGKQPRNVAFSSDGTKIFVALLKEPSVEVYEVPSLKPLGKLPLPSGGSGAGFSDVEVFPDRSEVWAVQTDGTMQIFGEKDLGFKEAFSWGTGGNAFVTVLGGKAALFNGDDGTIEMIDVAARTAGKPVYTNASPRGLGFSASSLFVSLFDSGKLLVIDRTSGTVTDSWKVGSAPRPVAVAGDKVFVGEMASGQLLTFSVSQKKLIASVPVGSNPHAFALSADSKLLAVLTRGKNNPQDYTLAGPDFGQVSLFDTASGQLLGSVWGRNQPTGAAFSPNGSYLAFTDFLDGRLELYKVLRPQ